MKKMHVRGALFAIGLALAGCGVAPPEEEPAPVAAEAQAASDGGVATASPSAQPELRLSPPSGCLPGEVTQCTVGPPPVCTCVPIVVVAPF